MERHRHSSLSTIQRDLRDFLDIADLMDAAPEECCWCCYCCCSLGPILVRLDTRRSAGFRLRLAGSTAAFWAVRSLSSLRLLAVSRRLRSRVERTYRRPVRRPVLAYQQLNNSSHGMGAMTFKQAGRDEDETAVEKRGRRRRRRGSESASAARACRRTRRRRRERPSKQGARPCRVARKRPAGHYLVPRLHRSRSIALHHRAQAPQQVGCNLQLATCNAPFIRDLP